MGNKCTVLHARRFGSHAFKGSSAEGGEFSVL